MYRLLPVLLLLLTQVVSAQDEAPAPITDTLTPGPVLLDDMAALEAATTDIRGLTLADEIERLFPTREAGIAYVLAPFEDEDVLAELDDANHFYRAFDFFDADTDLYSVYMTFLEAQVGGFYDPEVKTMNTLLLLSTEALPDALPVLERIVYVHEFTHALQDDHFDLLALTDQIEAIAAENPDAAQAALSLIEGDATVVMNLYTVQLAQEDPFGVLIDVLAQGAATNTLTLPEGVPRIIERELTSPYLDGEAFVQALRLEGGWERVNAAFDALPTSTEQILHPEKYLAGEQPLPVTLKDGEGVLGDDWTLLYDRPMGQFFLREYLYTQVGPRDAIDAAAGWGGDRYQLYVNGDGSAQAFVFKLLWDTPADADEFTAAYTAFGDARFETAADAEGCWVGADAICFMPLDTGGHLISYGPDHATARALLTHQAP